MELGRWLLFCGLLLTVAGLIVMALGRFHIPMGRLPGDLVYRGRNTTVYLPWVTCLIVSVVGTLVLWLINRLR